MNILELIYGIIAEPKKTFRQVGMEKPVLLSLLFYLTVLLLTGILDYRLGAADLELAELMEMSGINLALPFALEQLAASLAIVIAFVTAVAALLFLFVQAGLYSLLAEFFGGSADGRGLLAGLAFAALPNLLVTVVVAIFRLVGFPAGIGIIGALVTLGWTVVLQVIAIKEILLLSIGKAVLILVLPGLAVLAALLILAVTAMAVFI